MTRSGGMSFSLILCLAIGTIGTYGSILAPGYELGSLYSGYQGDYAGKYNNYEPRSYAFEYGVSDPHTGDHKNQWETKDKEGTVRGSYSLLEPDGSTRIVDYIADEHGFRAVVKKVGIHGTSVESHGGAEVEATPQIAVAAPITHLAHQPTIIEEPIAYKSYDGGYEDYTGLKPVLADVYTKPLEYIRAPKAEGLLINVPEHHEIPSSYSQNVLDGHKIALPQEYLGEQYVPHHEQYNLHQNKYIFPEEKYSLPQEKYDLPQEKYVLPQEKYVLPQEEYVLPQEKYVLPQEKYVYPQEKYVLPQEKYVLHQEKHVLPQEKYILPQEHHTAPALHYAPVPQQIQDYIVPNYNTAPHHLQASVHAPIPEYKFAHDQGYQAPISYQGPLEHKEYLSPHQVPLEKGAYSYVQEQRYDTPKGKAVLVESPKVAYVEGPKAAYNLNVNYPW